MRLSQTKSAIRRRRMRQNETPKAKRIRLLKRYIAVAEFESIQGYPHHSRNALRQAPKIKAWTRELDRLVRRQSAA